MANCLITDKSPILTLVLKDKGISEKIPNNLKPKILSEKK